MSAPAQQRWWWVRHAPVSGMEGCLYGRTDAPIVALPSSIYEATRALLPAQARWSVSPLLRARQSCERLDAQAAASIEPAFREQDFGALEGMRYADIWAGEGRAFLRDPGGTRPPEGESFAELTARVRAAVEAGCDRDDADVVVVAHAGVIRAALCMAAGLSGSAALAFDLRPLSVTALTWLPSEDCAGWRIDFVNRVASENTL